MGSVHILGIVGSPHRLGLTSRLVESSLRGCRERGAETRVIHLVDYEIKPWTDETRRAPEELNTLLRNADGYILGAPVYYLDVNGLTKDFMDTADFGDANGKPGLGISMAGGTGKGLVLAAKSIYYFFFCKGIRGIEPLPVSRFNYEKALKRAYQLGRYLAQAAEQRRPFRSLGERLEYFTKLKYMDYDMADEILLLAGHLLEASPKNDELKEDARRAYERAMGLIEQGDRLGAIRFAVEAYELLYF